VSASSFDVFEDVDQRLVTLQSCASRKPGVSMIIPP